MRNYSNTKCRIATDWFLEKRDELVRRFQRGNIDHRISNRAVMDYQHWPWLSQEQTECWTTLSGCYWSLVEETDGLPEGLFFSSCCQQHSARRRVFLEPRGAALALATSYWALRHETSARPLPPVHESTEWRFWTGNDINDWNLRWRVYFG